MSLIDVIVGVKNEEKHIKKCITSLQNQNIGNIGIIVTDGLSNDNTRLIVKELMKEDKRIKLLNNEKEIISSGRNIGLGVSDADFIAYIDGHTFVDANWLEILYNTYLKYEKKCKLGCVGSTYAIPEDEKILGKVIDYCFKTTFGGFGTSFTEDHNIKKVDTVAFGLYKRSIINELNISYDEQMTHCEDTDFNYKLIKEGYILLKHPEAMVYQYKRQNLRDFYKQMFNYGIGRAKFLKKYHETMKLSILIPLFFVLYLIFLIFATILFFIKIIDFQIQLIIFIPAILYLIVNMFYTLISIGKLRNVKATIAFLVFLTEHIAYGTGFFKGLLKTK